ncbi:unnamed protein product [Ascophyllum nodosum]
MPEGDQIDNSRLGFSYWLLVVFGFGVVGLTAAATTGEDWVTNATIALDNAITTEWCDGQERAMSKTWCSNYRTFEALQTTAVVLSGVGMVFLLTACCMPRPQTVECFSGVIFVLHAAAQASAIGLLTILKDSFDDEVFSENIFERGDTSLDDDLFYGTTFWVAIAAMAGGLIEGIDLCLIARSKS